MPKRFVGVIVSSLLLSALFAAPISAGEASRWHRLNPSPDPTGAEHERLTCLEGRRIWSCFYDKVPDESFAWNRTVGLFTGVDTTRSWSCPEWFPSEACTGVVKVLSGKTMFLPEDGEPFSIPVQYIVTSSGTQQTLHVYWVGSFVCPWFRTFDEAVAANPSRMVMDCTFV